MREITRRYVEHILENKMHHTSTANGTTYIPIPFEMLLYLCHPVVFDEFTSRNKNRMTAFYTMEGLVRLRALSMIWLWRNVLEYDCNNELALLSIPQYSLANSPLRLFWYRRGYRNFFLCHIWYTSGRVGSDVRWQNARFEFVRYQVRGSQYSSGSNKLFRELWLLLLPILSTQIISLTPIASIDIVICTFRSLH